MPVLVESGWSLFTLALHAVAALACLSVAFLLWRQARAGRARPLIIAALGASAVHLFASVPGVMEQPAVWMVVGLRNLVWLALLRALFAADGRHASLRPVGPVIVALAMTELAQIPLVVLSELFAMPLAFGMIAKVSAIFHLLFVIGMLVLVHNLYVGAGPQQRPRLRWMAAALVLAWGYELNVFAAIYLSGAVPEIMAIGRALAWGGVAALVWIDARQPEVRRFSPSRTVTFQTLSLLVIAAYLFALFAIDGVIASEEAGYATLSRFGAVVLAVSVAAVIASPGLRAWLREVAVRNLFRHRFDYREEWLRLSRTIAGRAPEAAPLEQRAIQALADIVDSPAGILLTPTEDGDMTLGAQWNWPSLEVPARAMPAAMLVGIEREAKSIALDAVRGGAQERYLPDWLIAADDAWALVPLQVEDRLTAMVVLARPAYARRLDWEDFDILRIVGQQLAAHLAEGQAQKALMEAARFDEFNRRMAFVMHDIKNLASQLGLVVSNAERHIEKPAFRADMLVTLRNATGRLEGLIGRLSHYGGSGVGALQALDVRDAVNKALAVEIDAGLVHMGPGGEEALLGDAEALEQALRHLARNAIEVSDGQPVAIGFARTDRLVGIEIADKGCGMSPEFIRTTLFKPFVSTKADGFGIGAFEARELVRAMGGRLEVESREGMGTRFFIWLPSAETQRDEPADCQRPTETDRKVA